jgi:hypothetical protein
MANNVDINLVAQVNESPLESGWGRE